MSRSVDIERILLVDMDGVLCDYVGHFDTVWRQRHPDAPTLDDVKGRSAYQVHTAYPEEYKADIYTILREPGFYRDLPAIPGAIEALKAIRKGGWDIYICTAPMTSSQTCLSDMQNLDEVSGAVQMNGSHPSIFISLRARTPPSMGGRFWKNVPRAGACRSRFSTPVGRSRPSYWSSLSRL